LRADDQNPGPVYDCPTDERGDDPISFEEAAAVAAP
jgi:hypothetical protein